MTVNRRSGARSGLWSGPWRRLLSLLLAGLLTPLAHAFNPHTHGWQLKGDMRTEAAHVKKEAHDGGATSSQAAGARIRAGAYRKLNRNWRFGARLAGEIDSGGNAYSLRLNRYRASGTGNRPGEFHVDELFLQWQDRDARSRIMFGRFQTAFGPPALASKNLDRKDSSDIGWTDGVYWQGPLNRNWNRDWQTHAIAQLNHRQGTGNTVRGPLDFHAHNSRVSTYLGLHSDRQLGPLSFRMLSLGWIPDGLAVDGKQQPARKDYLTATIKAAAEWPVSTHGTRLVLAGERGHAFNRPDRTVMGLINSGNGSAKSGGEAWQFSLNLFDILPRHSAAIIWARADAGWLISSKIRPNERLQELRYRYQIRPDLRVELRYRTRHQLEAIKDATQPHKDRNLRIRLAWKF